MFHAVDLNGLAELQDVCRSMFLARGEQFVERHKWPLFRDTTGLEIDEYDDEKTIYCVVERDGRHLASLRVRPAAAGSMVETHFPTLCTSGAITERLGQGAEITRFCAAPGLSPEHRLNAVSDLLLGLCRQCQRAGIDTIFGVVFPPVARVIRHAGWECRVLSEVRDDRGHLCLAEWEVSDLVAWNIQERREYREEILRRHRERQDAATATPRRRAA